MHRIDDLIRGFRKFRERDLHDPRFQQLVTKGQSPSILLVACSDSRVDPALVFDARPGDLFVVRNVANLVPPYEPSGGHHGVSAAIEFAVTTLHVRHAVVCGHSHCGGVRALMEGTPAGEESFVARWMQLGEPARRETLGTMPDRPLEDRLRRCERAIVAHSLRNLRTFPFVADAVSAGELAVQGLYVRLDEGALYRLGAGDAWDHVA
jgi:carbonic anhydrase